jgi:hypothetical protein
MNIAYTQSHDLKPSAYRFEEQSDLVLLLCRVQANNTVQIFVVSEVEVG